MPITWRNVNGPDFSGVSQTLARAGESLTEGVDAIRQGKDTFEQGRTDRNTQAFKEQLSQFGSPEELAAAQESGQVANMRSEFGNLINRGETDSDAITDRVTGLRQQATADDNYQQTLQGRADRPFMEQANKGLSELSLDGDPDVVAGQVKDLRSQLVENGASDRVMTDFNTQSRSLLQDVQSENRSDRNQANKIEDRRTRLDRAKETHEWNMKNRAYKTEQRAISEKKRLDAEEKKQKGEEMDLLAGNMVNEFTEVRSETENQRNQVARELGFTMVNGMPDLNSQPAAKRQELQNRTRDLESANAGATIKDFGQQLNAQGITGEEFETRMSDFRARLKTQTDLPVAAAKKLANQIAVQQQLRDTQIERETENFNRASGANGFYDLDGKDPNAVAADVLQVINDEDFASSDDGIDLWGLLDNSDTYSREGITRSVSAALSGDMTGPEGQKLRASEGMVRQAFFTAFKSSDPSGSFEETLKTIMSRPENIRQSMEAGTMIEEHRNNIDEINSNYAAVESGLQVKARLSADMVPVTNQRFEEILGRSLKPDMPEKEQEKVIKEAAKSAEKETKSEQPKVDPVTKRLAVEAEKEARKVKEAEEQRNEKERVMEKFDISPERAQGYMDRQESFGNFLSGAGDLVEGFITAPNIFDSDNIVNQGYKQLGDGVVNTLEEAGDGVVNALKEANVRSLPQYSSMSPQEKKKLPEAIRQTLQKALDLVN